MGYSNKGSLYPDLKNATLIAKTDGDKLKFFAEQLKSAFTIEIDLEDKNLEKEIKNSRLLTIKIYG